MDCSPPGSSVHRISQARILEWVTISFFRGSSQPRDWTHTSCVGRQILYCWATREARSNEHCPVLMLPQHPESTCWHACFCFSVLHMHSILPKSGLPGLVLGKLIFWTALLWNYSHTNSPILDVKWVYSFINLDRCIRHTTTITSSFRMHPLLRKVPLCTLALPRTWLHTTTNLLSVAIVCVLKKFL